MSLDLIKQLTGLGAGAISFLNAMKSFIQPEINYVEQKLESIGAAFLGGLATIGANLLNDQRAIGAQCIAFWQAQYHANLAGGMNALEALENASTETLNKFYNDERADVQKVVSAICTLMEVTVLNGLNDLVQHPTPGS